MKKEQNKLLGPIPWFGENEVKMVTKDNELIRK
jgi:hypothetical protein